MQVVYDRITIDNCLSTTLPWNTAASSTCITNKNLPTHQWISFIAEDAAKYSKVQYFLLIIDSTGGTTAP